MNEKNSASLKPISFSQFPELPHPCISEGPGETWIWGDYFLTLLKNPPEIESIDKSNPKLQSFYYPYAMNVYYRKDKKPELFSSMPVMTLAIEQVNSNFFNAITGSSPENNAKFPDKMPLMPCIYTADSHQNFGECHGQLTKDGARDAFFNLIRHCLTPDGEPKLIGSLNDAFSNSRTGLSSREELLNELANAQNARKKSSNSSSKTGCLGSIVFFLIFIFVIGFMALQNQPKKFL